MNKHTTARRGKRVHVVMLAGPQFTDKLLATKSTFYEFEREGRVLKSGIRSFSIYRPQGKNP